MNNTHERQEEEERARCEWDFRLAMAVISPTPDVSDAVGAIEFDPTGRLLATGGIARKIRIYPTTTLLPSHHHHQSPILTDHSAASDFYICTPAKLSSLKFHTNSSSLTIASGDYDGVVTEYNVETRVAISERDEHGGRKVYSIDYHHQTSLGTSGSEDGTFQIWDIRSRNNDCISRTSLGNAVCSVEFDKNSEWGISIGCADRKAYVYDIRSVSAGPTVVFDGHGRTVTYVRLVRGGRAVSSGTDGCHRMWMVEDGREVKVYKGHENKRSFVGMEVWGGGGLIACGSESDEVFVWDLRWEEPIWVRGFGLGMGGAAAAGDDGFVSAICWREIVAAEECALVAGGSGGVLQVFSGKKKPLE